MGSPSGVNSSFLSRLPEEDKQAIKLGQQARWAAAVDANAGEQRQQSSPARPPTDAAYAGASPTSSGSPSPGNTTSSSPSVVAYNTTEPHPNFPGSPSPLDIINPPLSNSDGSGGEDPSRPISVFNPPASGAPSSAEPTSRPPTDAAYADAPPAGLPQPDSFVDRQRDIDLLGTGNYSVSRAMQAELDADVEGARDRVAKLEDQLQNLPTGSFSHIVRAELEDELAKLETQLRAYDLPGDADASIAEGHREEDEAEAPATQDQLDAEAADARVLASGDNYDQHHFINPRTGREYTDAEVRYARDTADFREDLSIDERIEFDRLFYDVGVGFDFDDALTIVGRDWHDAFNIDGNGIQRDDLQSIAHNEDGIFSSDQQAAAFYLLSRPDAFNGLESNYGSGYPVHDGAIGEDNITTAGGEIGPTIEQRIEAQKAALEGLGEQPGVDSEAVSEAISVLDAAQGSLTPAEYARVSNYLSNVALGGQAAIAVQSALTGDYDEAYETTFDAAVPFVIKQILTKIAPGAAGGPAGVVGLTALSLLLAFTPLDTSETRVASFSENAGEISPTGQRTYPGGYGTQINGNGFADPMYRG
jgi:hypothetical protein